MSETPLMTKTLQPYPEHSKISELHEFTFSPYLGALELQFALGPFHKILYLSLIALYQLESIHLDDSNLIYSQKKKGFYKNFDSNSFKNPTFYFVFFFFHAQTWFQNL